MNNNNYLLASLGRGGLGGREDEDDDISNNSSTAVCHLGNYLSLLPLSRLCQDRGAALTLPSEEWVEGVNPLILYAIHCYNAPVSQSSSVSPLYRP